MPEKTNNSNWPFVFVVVVLALALLGRPVTVQAEAETEIDGNGNGEGVCLNQDDPTCRSSHPLQHPAADSPSTSTSDSDSGTVGSLHPQDLPGPVVFTDFTVNSTFTLEDQTSISVAEGSVDQINQAAQTEETTETTESTTTNANTENAYSTEFSVLPNALTRSSVASILELLDDYQYYDEDPDTVDGMPTYEIFVASPDLSQTQTTNKVRDTDANFLPYRIQLRTKLQAILQPYLQTILTPYVQQRYKVACQSTPSRYCTPCYSLIRRYRHGDRVSHATHHDGHAIVTVVVSLSDYDRDYRGGLYVSTGYGQREYLALNKGDAVVHRSTLLHGVQVYDNAESSSRNNNNNNNNNRTLSFEENTTHRWSWILWYRDSPTCQDHSHEWFAECSHAGNALCQQLHSTKVAATPGLSHPEVAQQVLELNRKAAQGGAGSAAVKVARAYLHQLASSLDFSVDEAMRYYQMAIASHHPDGHYGMAMVLLQLVHVELQQQQQQQSSSSSSSSDSSVDTTQIYKDPRIVQAVQHLEAAARLGHSFSKFNLGMVHTYGYATGVVNGTMAADWFEASGLPEGYYVAAQQAKAVGNRERYTECARRAQALGFTAPWRKQAREATGSGGAGGVNLNLPWPPSMDGRTPPQL